MYRVLIIALLAAIAIACASTPEQAPEPELTPIAEAPQAEPVEVAALEPEPELQPEPKPVLPKTASPVPGFGLAGLSALGAGVGLRWTRRRLL
jgi:LPXTG-motif cell wall-anchored protein